MSRRLNAGEVFAVLGAALLLVSLFLDWYEPDLSAWTVFEIVDLVLAAIAGGTLVATVGAWFRGPVSIGGERALTYLAAGAFSIVAASLIDPPPAASESDPEVGAWLALAGTALMVAGALMRDVRLSIVIAPREDVDEPEERYDEPSDPYTGAEPLDPGAETEPLDRR
jgi:peptidoglycan/LPS O-acetylase OafA/YrhL